MKIALVQLDAGTDWRANVAAAERWVLEAAEQGAELILLPEVCLQRGVLPGDERAMPLVQDVSGTDPIVSPWIEMAQRTEAYLLLGSVSERSEVAGKPFNTSILLGPGGVIASYRKVHLFDIDAGDGATDKESDRFSAGDEAVVADTPLGKLGLTICYDLRFPELFRKLALAEAKLITVPANFTKVTGEAHWSALLRARAIESGVFIVAPAQCGSPIDNGGGGPGTFEAYGHSMVVDPWGKVLLEMDDRPGIGLVEIDLDEVDRVQAKIPSLMNRRPDVYA